MQINSINSQNFGTLYCKRALGLVLTDTQNAIRSDILFNNHKYPDNGDTKYLGIDVYDKKARANKDILKIIVERLDKQGKDVFVIFTKDDRIVTQVRDKNANNNDAAPFGTLLSEKCVLYPFTDGESVPEVTYNKICNFLTANVMTRRKPKRAAIAAQ